MPNRRIELTGMRFGRLVVLGYEGIIRKEPMWKVRCDCGCEFITHGKSLRMGRTRSCGCLNLESFMLHRKNVQKGCKRGPYNTKKRRHDHRASNTKNREYQVAV